MQCLRLMERQCVSVLAPANTASMLRHMCCVGEVHRGLLGRGSHNPPQRDVPIKMRGEAQGSRIVLPGGQTRNGQRSLPSTDPAAPC